MENSGPNSRNDRGGSNGPERAGAAARRARAQANRGSSRVEPFDDEPSVERRVNTSAKPEWQEKPGHDNPQSGFGEPYQDQASGFSGTRNAYPDPLVSRPVPDPNILETQFQSSGQGYYEGQGNAVVPHRSGVISHDVSPKSKALAIFMSLTPFVAQAGIHDFYLGYAKRGFIHLGLWVGSMVMFFVPFIGPPIAGAMAFCVFMWWIIDAIMLIAGTGPYKTDGVGRPLV